MSSDHNKELGRGRVARCRARHDGSGRCVRLANHPGGCRFAKRQEPVCENCDGVQCMGCVTRELRHECAEDCPSCCGHVNDFAEAMQFTDREMRIALTAFAIWMGYLPVDESELAVLPDEAAALVDRFIEETT